MNDKFKELNLDNSILKAVKQQNFKEPTEIQIKTIPLILKNKNFIAQSATGSGKTFAFIAPIIQKIEFLGMAQALIVVPTRELAQQVYNEAKIFSKYKKLNISCIYGGVPLYRQKKELAIADLIITTPGRILDHLERKNVNLKNLKTLVLDEADRMCDLGFFDDVEKIINKSNDNKQILLYSATISKAITKLEKKYIKNCDRIVVEFYVDSNNLKQTYYRVKATNKLSLLLHLLLYHDQKSIVFCNTRSYVDLIEHNLSENQVNCLKLHGGLDQKIRTQIIKEFRSSKNTILVCTDVAARGIDIKDINIIYNFDLPECKNSNKEYVHRIGRTARAGKKGTIINIVNYSDTNHFLKMIKSLKFEITEKKLPEFKVIRLSKVDSKKPKAKYTLSYYKSKNDSKKVTTKKSYEQRKKELDEKEKKEYKTKRKKFVKKDRQVRSKNKRRKYNKR